MQHSDGAHVQSFDETDLPSLRSVHSANDSTLLKPIEKPIDSSEIGLKTNAPAANLTTGQSIYGSFSLRGTEFALPVSVVQEVVNEPEAYTAVPLAPDYLLGLFNLRGNIIPVVNLSSIFKLDTAEPTSEPSGTDYETRKVAILEFGNLCLGLLFDSTGEVFNNNDVETCMFENAGPSIQDQIIAGVFKMDDGNRIVQLLDVHGMLQLDQIPQSRHNGSISASSRRRGKRRQCISFEVGDSCCALDISAIKEIVNIGKIENTVLAGSLCLGAIDLRGNTIPIVNFSLLLGYSDAGTHDIHEADPHRIIIMKVDDNLFGLLVSQINNIVSYFDDELTAFPVLGNQKTAMFRGYVSGEDAQMSTIFLEHSEIFSHEEIHTITKGHSALFKDIKDPSFIEKQGSLNRKTLITFSLNNFFGLEISEVLEVVDYPSELITTPSMSKHIRGMINLRGELIAIIDTRHLYDLEEFADHQSTKILVFEVENTKYGLMVDTVNSIETFSDSDSATIPAIVFSSENGVIDKDVKQAVMVNSGDTQHTVCVLNLKSVAQRATLVN